MGYLKLFRFMSVVMLHTKCKLNNNELCLKLFHIENKEIGNNKYYGETTELEKWQSEISPEYGSGMEDSRLNAIKQLITFLKGD